MAAQKDKRDMHQEITDRILAALETADPADWSPPWITMTAQGLPMNAATRKQYRGVNILNLWAESIERGFTSNKWGTFRQWKDVGASVRKGEKASRVVFYKSLKIRDPEAKEDEISSQDRTIPLLRYSSVFNADQVDGFEDPDAEGFEPPSVAETVAACDAFLDGTGADIRRNGGRAYYDPGADYIGLPADELYTSTEGKYSVAFHELTHWTGHRKRLDRDMSTRFGSAKYAAEELVAELGAAFLAASFRIEAEPREDHARYIAHWIRLLKDDKKAIFTAASRASDAVAYAEEITESRELIAA